MIDCASFIRINMGWHWYTDGTRNITIKDGDEIPDGFYPGRYFSDYTKSLIAKNHKGGNKKGLGGNKRGFHHTEEAKKKMSISHKGLPSPTKGRKLKVS